MPSNRWTLRRTLAAPLLLCVSGLAAAEDAEISDPLFQSYEPIEARITGPFKTLKRERSDEEDLQAIAVWQEADGRTVEVDVGLRARGNYRRRRDTCPFPPIRLNFKTSTVEGTYFHNQDKLKLVTHCRDRSRQYLQAMLREYLTYRLFNVMSDISYRVRLLRVTYEDTESKRKPVQTIAFVIEHKDRFAERTGLPVVAIPRASVVNLDPEFTNLTSVFQYLVGNTDYSPIAGAEGRDCCHNVNLFGGSETRIFPVPYDFDMSGMIDADYASPNPRFGLRNVQQRLYRGRCRNNNRLPETIQAFKDKRDALTAVIANDQLMEKSSRNKMLRYLESFFRIIDDPKAVDKRIVKACVN